MTTNNPQPDAPNNPNDAPSVAIVGATGAVGQEFLRVLEQRNFPIAQLKLLASPRSAGKQLQFKGQTHTVQELTPDSFNDVDLALFSAGGDISRQYAPIAVDAGAVVVDNSSAFRMAEGVPLVVPEVNPDAVGDIGLRNGHRPGIIANPNCSTIIMLLPVTPLHRAAGIRRMVVSTYQAASGAGAAAMAELEQQTREVLAGQPPTCDVFDRQYAFNLFSHNSDVGQDGYNTEEVKMVRETHKIWNDPDVPITATCVRVPIMRAHAESIYLELEQPLTHEQATQILQHAPGVALIDDREQNRFPTPLDASGNDDVLVGRIRSALTDQNHQPPQNNALCLFVCGDQLRKGAALNAVQIAELLL